MLVDLQEVKKKHTGRKEETGWHNEDGDVDVVYCGTGNYRMGGGCCHFGVMLLRLSFLQHCYLTYPLTPLLPPLVYQHPLCLSLSHTVSSVCRSVRAFICKGEFNIRSILPLLPAVLERLLHWQRSCDYAKGRLSPAFSPDISSPTSLLVSVLRFTPPHIV